MLKNMLKAIKDDLWDVRSCKRDVQYAIKEKEKELEARRKEALAEYAHLPEDDWFRQMMCRETNKRFNQRICREIDEIYRFYQNDQTYYIIYKDGSETWITAEEILGGEPFPKLSDIVYAELSSAYDHFDTETGDLNFYSEAAMEACGWDYEDEDERQWQYETAIQIKYQTEWGKRWTREHPDFVPIAL